jgi:hypothetical protein
MSERIDYTKISPRGVKALGGVHLYVAQSGPPEALLAAVREDACALPRLAN